MEHADFARIIATFEQERDEAVEAAEETRAHFRIVSDKLAEARAEIGIVQRERDEAKAALGSAAHKVGDVIAEACEHIHDADTVRKSAFLDCARIARGVNL